MERFIILKNMRDYPCYSNVNARLVYLHAACQMDVTTYTCAKSLRQMAKELGLGLEAVRHAVRQLERDGLIATHVATQTTTHPTTYLTTQQTTHLTILKVNENGAPNGAPNNTPANTPSNTPRNTPRNTQNRVIGEGEKESLPLTDARVVWAQEARALADVLKIDPSVATSLVEEFRKRQQLKQKAWLNEGDLLAHLIAWAEKRMPRQTKAAVGRSVTDHDARVQERQRTLEEEAAKTAEEKKDEEVQRLRRWIADGRKRNDSQYVATMEAALAELQAS